MHRQVSGNNSLNNSLNTSLKRRFKHFLFFCLLSPSMLYAVGTNNEIAFVGASFTAGMGKAIFHNPASHYFEQIRYDNSFSVINYSPVNDPFELNNIMNSPVDKLTKQINKAVQRAPKVIIAIDALFWVVYHSQSDVMKRLEKALAIMTQAKQNFVISLLPAISIKLGKQTYRSSQATIKAVNQRLRKWRQDQNQQNHEQGKVLLLELESAFAEDPIFDCGTQLDIKPREDIMLEDDLHPTEYGHLCLAGKLLGELSQSQIPQFNFVASHFNGTELHNLSTELLLKDNKL